MPKKPVCTCRKCGLLGREVSAETRRQHEIQDRQISDEYARPSPTSPQSQHREKRQESVDLAEGPHLVFLQFNSFWSYYISYFAYLRALLPACCLAISPCRDQQRHLKCCLEITLLDHSDWSWIDLHCPGFSWLSEYLSWSCKDWHSGWHSDIVFSTTAGARDFSYCLLPKVLQVVWWESRNSFALYIQAFSSSQRMRNRSLYPTKYSDRTNSGSKIFVQYSVSQFVA